MKREIGCFDVAQMSAFASLNIYDYGITLFALQALEGFQEANIVANQLIKPDDYSSLAMLKLFSTVTILTIYGLVQSRNVQLDLTNHIENDRPIGTVYRLATLNSGEVDVNYAISTAMLISNLALLASQVANTLQVAHSLTTG